MSVTLYCFDRSPASRAVYLCVGALGLEVTKRFVNLPKLEHRTPWYLNLNPQHTTPTLDDNGVVVWDSHAINMYLVTKYGKDDSLYPKELSTRAIVDQRLHFDSGILFPRLRDITDWIVFKPKLEVPQEMIDRVYEAFDFLEVFLEGKDYVAGNHFTIADFSCVASVSSFVEAIRFSTENHPLIFRWLQRCRENLPGYAESQDHGLMILKQGVDERCPAERGLTSIRSPKK